MSNSLPQATMSALVYDTHPVRWTACKVFGWISTRVYWSRLGGLRLTRVPVPELPNPSWVRLRPLLGGICGTDIGTVMQRSHPASILQAISSLPAVMGHENVSIVESVGDDVTRFKPGDRVVVESALSCEPRGITPPCPQCAEGRFTLCENFRAGPLPVGSMIGYNNFTGGSWAEYFVAHESQLHAVPDEIDDEQAVLVDPLAGAVHSVLRRMPGDDETVLIVGAGFVGIGVAAAIRALGSRCRILALVRNHQQAEQMKRFGASETISIGRSDSQAIRYQHVARVLGGNVVATKFGHQAVLGGGADVVYDCVGTGQSLTDAMKYVRAAGTVIEVGTSNITLVDTAPLWFDELNLLGTNGRAIESYDGRHVHTYGVVFDLITHGHLDTSGLLTHTFRLDEYRLAFETLLNRSDTGAIKVAFRPA